MWIEKSNWFLKPILLTWQPVVEVLLYGIEFYYWPAWEIRRLVPVKHLGIMIIIFYFHTSVSYAELIYHTNSGVMFTQVCDFLKG